jgi:hypothetical protein
VGDEPLGDDAPADAADGAASGGDGPTGDDGGSDASDGGPTATNIAPAGTGYTWQSMTSASANTGRTAAPAVNDGSPATQANIDSSTGDKANAWEAAGVTFPTGHTVVSVRFVQGTTVSSDGWFEANLGMEVSTDGSTWTAPGWTFSPAYAYSNAVSGKTYTFSGLQLTGIEGVRIVGQVNTTGNSWWAAVSEVMVFGN